MQILLDNIKTFINKLGRSTEQFDKSAKLIHQEAIHIKIIIEASYLSGTQNLNADYLSRLLVIAGHICSTTPYFAFSKYRSSTQHYICSGLYLPFV